MAAYEPKEPEHLAYIDSLRGLAFLGVIICHVASRVDYFPCKTTLVAGYNGVSLFFLVSALTLCLSAEKRIRIDRLPWASFYLRRLFRIGPLFWLAIAFYAASPVYMRWGARDNSIENMVLAALFLHGWHPRPMLDVVPGGWSVAIEMTFYLLFPLCFTYVNSLKKAVVALFILFFVGQFATWMLSLLWPFLFPSVDDSWDAFSFQIHWFPYQAPVFLMGFLIYLFRRERGCLLTNPFWMNSLFLFCCMLYLSFPGTGGFIPIVLLQALPLTGIVVAMSSNLVPWAVNPCLSYIGRISYSCYLVHFAVLGWILHSMDFPSDFHQTKDSGGSWLNLVLFLKVLASGLCLTLVVSTISYHLIEKTGISIGRKIIRRLNRPPSTLSVSGGAIIR